MMTSTKNYDVSVVGGGLVGSAIAHGLAKAGQRVVVLDEGRNRATPSRHGQPPVTITNQGSISERKDEAGCGLRAPATAASTVPRRPANPPDAAARC